jgi:hypothetical protein
MWLLYVFVIIFFIIWITTGFYISFSNTAIKRVRNDTSSNSAYNWSLSAEITTWTLLCLAVLGGIGFFLFFIFGGEVLLIPEELIVVSKGRKIFDIAVMVGVIILGFLLFVTGICSVMTAVDIVKSPSFDSSNENYANGYKYAIISAVLSLSSLGALFIVYAGIKIHEYEKRKKHRKQFEERLEHSNEIKAKKTSEAKSSTSKSKSSTETIKQD